MRFYNGQHQYYCGIDLHVKTMYLCILDGTGQVLVHRNLPSTPAGFLEAIAPYRPDIVVGVECMFTWYWFADVCAAEGLAFVLGHALAMKAIHGGKAKNDKISPHEGREEAARRDREKARHGARHRVFDGDIPRGVAGRELANQTSHSSHAGPSSPRSQSPVRLRTRRGHRS